MSLDTKNHLRKDRCLGGTAEDERHRMEPRLSRRPFLLPPAITCLLPAGFHANGGAVDQGRVMYH